MKYRKKPIVIDAVTVREVIHNARSDWRKNEAWVSEAYERGDILFTADAIEVKSREGWVRGNPNYMLLRGVEGEIYLCAPSIFEATYEPVK